MKVGTLSINLNTINHNYGAILHSWAFQQILLRTEEIEYTEVIDYLPRYEDKINLKYPINFYFKKGIRNCILWLVYLVPNAIKYVKVEKFIQNNFIKTKRKYNDKTIQEENFDYDAIVCESDVIWNPHHYGYGFEKSFFLVYKNMEKFNKIAYSASLGNADFTEEEEVEYRELLKTVDHISLREAYAVEYTKKFTEKPLEHVLDPTLLLNPSDYDKITGPRLVKQKYLLIYFPLGYNINLIRLGRKYAKSHNLKVIEISRYIWNNVSHKVYSTANVDEFLSLIKNAEIVFTNSFHGVCFSIIFNRNFYVFDRETGRKTKDLCESFGLSDRYVDKNFFFERSNINYNEINCILEKKRRQSILWLSSALKLQF